MEYAKRPRLAIVCGGGPAPGMNSVINSVTIEACNKGWEVFGIYDGFAHLYRGKTSLIALTIDGVSRIHMDGGSIIRTSRFNPSHSKEHLRKVVESLLAMEITHLVTIGGDGTANVAAKVAAYARDEMGEKLAVVHVPKTIDNDLPLPEGIPTFGFETARSLGAQIVTNLMTDAKTTGRWFFVVAMGRSAGHLALGIGKSAGTTLIVIPEDFRGRRITMQELADILTGSIIKRLAAGRDYGVAVIAEGVYEIIDADEAVFTAAERDEYGHLRLADVNFSEAIKREVMHTLKELKIDAGIIDKEIGYEVRCAPPNAFDIEYTRNLGYAAFDFLHQGGSDAVITIQNNQVVPVPFEEIIDPATGRTKRRMVNVDSLQYIIAQKYMIRLEESDFSNAEELGKLAAIANMTPEDFVLRFGYLVKR